MSVRLPQEQLNFRLMIFVKILNRGKFLAEIHLGTENYVLL